MERHRHVQAHYGEAEQLPPEGAGECGVTVADDRARQPMESRNLDEGAHHCGRRVRVPEGNEVGVLRESVDHDQHHRFVVDAWKPLDEIQCDVDPDRQRHLQRLQETGGVQLLYFVLLARRTGADKVLDERVRATDEEVGANEVEHLLHASVSRTVCPGKDVWNTRGCGGDENATANSDQVVDDGPLAGVGTLQYFLPKCHHCRICRELGSSSKSTKEGTDRAFTIAGSSVLRWERASTTMFVEPGLYSTRKLKPRSLLAHWCCRIIDKR
jgi:hypothetical protein